MDGRWFHREQIRNRLQLEGASFMHSFVSYAEVFLLQSDFSA